MHGYIRYAFIFRYLMKRNERNRHLSKKKQLLKDSPEEIISFMFIILSSVDKQKFNSFQENLAINQCMEFSLIYIL